MFLGRLFGWTFLLLAVFTASAEAVAALPVEEKGRRADRLVKKYS